MLNGFIKKFCEIKGTDFDMMDGFFLEMDFLDNVVLLQSQTGVDISISFDGLLYVTFLSFEVSGNNAYIYTRPKDILSATSQIYPSLLLDYLNFIGEYRTDDMTQPTECREYCYISPAIMTATSHISSLIKRAVLSILEI